MSDSCDLPAEPTFDKIVSVGMIEHVGLSRLRDDFRRVWRALVAGGLFLNDGLVAALARVRPVRSVFRPRTFIDRYNFPDGEPP